MLVRAAWGGESLLPRQGTITPRGVQVDGIPSWFADVAVVPGRTRPTVWDEPVALEGMYSFMTATSGPGTYSVWVRISDEEESPVVARWRPNDRLNRLRSKL